MNKFEWLKPALGGASVGAIAAIAIGFSVGGWVTQGTSERRIASNISDGVALALTPEFKAAPAYSRRTLIEKSGWATPLGTEQPNTALATACGNELAKAL
jgi:hypothetical protein